MYEKYLAIDGHILNVPIMTENLDLKKVMFTAVRQIIKIIPNFTFIDFYPTTAARYGNIIYSSYKPK